MQNVCFSEDYDVTKPPNAPTQVANFGDIKVLDINKKKKEITVSFFMFSAWEDSRIKANLTRNSNAILLPQITFTMQTIWHPFATGIWFYWFGSVI